MVEHPSKPLQNQCKKNKKQVNIYIPIATKHLYTNKREIDNISIK